jgi:hypothetical protein
VKSLLRPLGRVAIWIVVGLLLIRGVGAVLASPQPSARQPQASGALAEPASSSLAVRFARAYLEGRSSRALAPLLAEGARVPAARRSGQPVHAAEPAGIHELGGGRAVLTVACELRDARTLYLAVPISRSGAGEVAVQGAPWIVAAPSVAGVAAERPRSLAGPDAAAIGALVAKFIPAYLAARSPGDLSYFLAPGAEVAPLGGSLELLGAPGAAAQIGEGEGSRRTVLAPSWVRDPAGGASYRLAYRLSLVRRGRWYVEAVEGTLS